MRFHRGSDGWGRDSYEIPQYAVVGASDTGTWSDSPAPSDVAEAELMAFREILHGHHIPSWIETTQSGNVFMVKVWVVVDKWNFKRAAKLARDYLKVTHDDTRLIHDADLEEVTR